MNEIEIRPETAADFDAIDRVIIDAFRNNPHSIQNEHQILRRLRAGTDLIASFVAVRNQMVVGQISFSKVLIDDRSCNWYLLAPLAVAPEYQRIGIGSKLVLTGLESLKALHADGCLLAGDPLYYGRFGFKTSPNLLLPGIPSEYLLYLPLNGTTPQGRIGLPPAFAEAE